MNHPKVKTVTPIDDHTLIIQFDNQQFRRYDVAPLMEKKMFARLKNPEFFKAVHVEQGGYAIVWDQNIDISEHELWQHGQAV